MKSFGSIRQPFRVISIATRLCYVLLAVCLPCSAVGHYDMTYPNRGSMLAAGWDFAARTVAGLVRDTEQTSGAVVSYDQSSHPGVLRIPVGSGDLWGSANNTQNSIFRNLPENWNTIRLKLSFAPTVNYQSASLVAYQDDETYAQVAVVYSNGARIVLNQEQNGGANTLVEAAASQSTVYLRLDRNITTETISGWYSTNGTTWISLGSMSLRLIMPRLGIVTGGSPNSFPSADISWAEVDVDPTHPPNYVSAYPSYHLFKAVAGGPAPSAQTASIISTAEGSVVGWSQTTNVPWLQVSPANGSSTGTLSISVNPAGLSAGVYNGTISVTPDISGGAVQMIPVTLVVKPDIPVSAATWLNGRKGALSVSVDDAYASCSNQLTASGFTGTYVTNGYSAPSFYTQYYGAGMELGSHLTVHACSTMNDALLTQYITLNIAAVCTPNTPAACASISTLAWPCGVTAEREKRIADQYFTSARGYNFNQLEEATPADFQNLKSYNSHEHSPIPPADLKTVVDAAEAQGKWANLVFHASCNDDGAISYAATKNIWAAPIGTVIRYILQRDRVVLSNYQTTAQKVSFSVSRLAIPAKTFLNVEQTLGAADKVTLQVALTGTPQISAVLVNGVSTPFQTENTQTGKTVYVNVLVDGSTKTVEVLTSAAAVSGLTLNPTSLSGGAGSLGTVTLNRPAPAGGIGVTLGSSSGAASVPPSVTVLEGAMSATFNINTSTVAVSTAVTVTATLGSSSSAVLTVVPALTSIAVTPSNPSIAKGLTQAFTATGTYTGGGTQNLTALVAWTSSNTSAATIVSSGLATGVGVGSSTIQATFGSVSGSTGITVLAPQLVSIAVTPGNASVLVGGTQAYAATGLYTDGSTQNVTSSVTWSSSSPAVATITAAGVATGVALGTTTVQATVGSISGSTSLMVASSLPGLVGGWNFNETSGTTAADSSGGGHPAALVNGPVWTAGQVGNAVSADGSNDSVNIPSIDLSGTSAVTLSMWVNRTYFNSGDRVLAEASANYNDTNSGFMLLMDNSSCGGIQLSLHGNAGYNVGCFTAPTSGVWHHLTVVFDKSQPGTGEIAFYIDGVLQTPRSSPIANNNTDTFGNNPIYLFSRGGSALFTAGMMDELRIYNRALSPSEVQQVYSYKGDPPAIVTQPASMAIGNGQTATLVVAASGAPALTYQWFLGESEDTSQPVAGATAETYTTPPLTVTTKYWVRITNNLGFTNSRTATVTVGRFSSSTTLTLSPNPAVAGQNVTLTASVTAGATGSVTFLDGTTNLGTTTIGGGSATLTTSQLAVGTHTLSATYAGDLNFTGSTSSAVTHVVNFIATSSILTVSPNPSVSGQSVTLSVAVSAIAPGSGTVTGTATFNDGASVLGTATLSGGSASLVVSTLTGGSHSLTATYNAAGNFATSTSSAVLETVNPASTATALTVSANPSVFGQVVTLTATVNPGPPGTGTVSGTVTFKDGAAVLGTATLSSGTATLAVTTLAVGSHSLTAAYAPTASYGASTSTVVTGVVKQAATTTIFTASPAASVSGHAITLTATVNPVAPGAGTPTGTVSLLSGTTVLGTGTLSGGTVSQIVSELPVGSYTFTVSYSGDPSFTGSTSSAVAVTVNQASTATTLEATPNPSVPAQLVTLTARVGVVSPGTGTAGGSVVFRDGTSTLGTVALNNGIATLSISTMAVGAHSLTAAYGGSTEFKNSASAAVTQNVGPASTTTALTSSANPSVSGQSVALTATVTTVAPGGTPTGTITFRDGTTVLGTAALSSGRATLAVSNLTVGGHSLTAAYGGATNFAASTSPAITQTVNLPSTTAVLTATPNPSILGQTVTWRVTVSVVAPGTGTPTGTVTFKDGAATLGTATLSSGTASLATSTLALGTHSVTAVYGGSANFSASTSAAVTQTVNLPSTTTVLTSNVNPSSYGQSTTLRAVVSPVPPATGTPSGTVTFRDGTTTIGTANLSGGAAVFAVSTLTGGAHSLTAVYGESSSFGTSTSAVITQTVNRASTSTGLTVSPSTSVYGQTVTLTATISSSSTNFTGTVTFKDGTTTLGTANVSGNTAIFTITTLSAASHSLTASYAGDTNYASSTSSTVTKVVSQASTTSKVVLSPNPSVFGQPVTLLATVSPVSPGGGTPTGTVSFRDGSTTLGTVTLSGGSVSLVTSALAVGNHSITVVYNDDSNFNTNTSPSVSQVIGQAATVTALTSSLNPSNSGQSVTFRATVSAVAPGGGTPTGSVIFKDGTITIGAVSLSGGVASLTTSLLSRATHTITAAYQASSGYSASTGTVTQTVR